MASLGLDIVDFVTVGIECTLRQLLEHGFFHAGALLMRWRTAGDGVVEGTRPRAELPLGFAADCSHDVLPSAAFQSVCLSWLGA